MDTDDDHSNSIASFCSLVGCPSHVASHYLDACGYDIGRAADFYFQNPPDLSGANIPEYPQRHLQQGLPAHFGVQPAEHSTSVQYPGLMHEDDEEMLEALAASMNPGLSAGFTGTAHSSQIEIGDDDDDDDDLPEANADLAMLSNLRSQALFSSREAAHIMEGMTNITRNRADRQHYGEGVPSMFPGLGLSTLPSTRIHPRSVPISQDGFEEDAGGGYGRPVSSPSGSRPVAELDLPEGFDPRELEEARMLESALLGVPYEGHIPDFNDRPAQPTRSLDPSLREHRDLRWEQDQAFEESLAADKAKAHSVAQAQHEADRTDRKVREATEAGLRRLERENRLLKETLAQKESRLPAEPPADAPTSVSIMVRLPDGSRQSRRFLSSSPLQAVFDYIDLQDQGSSLKPGSYNLVTSYPRKAYSDGTCSTLEEAGIMADTALFLEPIKGDVGH